MDGFLEVSVILDIYFKRRNKGMEQNIDVKIESNDQHCSFCNSNTPEIKSILRIAFTQLRKMLKTKRYADMPVAPQENNGAISRLMRVVFEQNQFELKMSKGCHHFRLRQ